jgi:hypothetical protein
VRERRTREDRIQAEREEQLGRKRSRRMMNRRHDVIEVEEDQRQADMLVEEVDM